MTKGSVSAVYFERLQNDAKIHKKRPELQEVYNAAMARYEPLSAEKHGFGGSAAILSMAAAEAAKEQAMLQQIFGEPINVDLSQPGAIKQLTEAINSVFHFRSIYERYKDLIMSETFTGQKGVFSYFNTYFKSALKENLLTMTAEIRALMEKNHSMGAGEAAKIVFQKHQAKMIDIAVKKMLAESQLENQNLDSQHLLAYQEILSFIQQFPDQNMFTQGLARAWGLDKVGSEFAKAFSTGRRRPTDKTTERALLNAANQINTNMHTKGGYSLEVLIDQCLAITAQGLNTASNVTATAGVHAGAGSVDARADNVFYFGIDGKRVDEAFQNVQKNSATREAAVKEFSRLGKELSEVKNGFIVYFNDKNYTLNDNFLRRKGMSAGTAWNLYQVRSLLGGIIGDIDQVIYNILQNGAGAIKAGDTAETSKVLAEGIAYYLFDDYSTIGNPSGNAIHIMGLQGMLIPLSAFLYALGTAIQSVENNPNIYVNVSILAPAVNDSDENSYYMDNWDRQYNESMTKTKISIHFMENFIGFVRGFL